MLVLFGAKKLPELAGSIGKSMKEFKKGVSQATEEEPVKSSRSCAQPGDHQQKCGSAKPLEPDWQHCPRCGAAAPSG